MKKLADKERKRVCEALKDLTVLDKKAGVVMELVDSYAKDAEHFYGQKKFLEAFELFVYVFGLLDALARLKLIDPGKSIKNYKVEQD
ncbi:MAG: DUF357 domain-containing protein [Nanoarchaeota archaeon]|nr:DUF357 domain-containing protein [Nanoarchaeota archaeon]